MSTKISALEQSFISGCDAIARGAWEAGIDVVASYPGSPVTGVVDAVTQYKEVKYKWSANEKVAMEKAAGVSYAGSRVLVVMKHVGLNVAADPFYNLAYTGIKGGLVVIVGDDPGAKNSQNEQDTRLVAKAANVPVLEPSNLQDVYSYTKVAFDLSEFTGLPVVVRVTSEHCYGSGYVTTASRNDHTQEKDFARPIQKYLLLPDFVPDRHQALINSLESLQSSHWSSWFYQSSLPKKATGKYPFGVICSGGAYELFEEISDGTIPFLKVGMPFPLDRKAVTSFSEKCESIIVLEDSSKFLEDEVKKLGINPVKRIHYTGVGELTIKDLLVADIPAWNQIVNSKLEDRHVFFDNVIPIKDLSDENVIEIVNPESLEIPKRPAGFCAGCSHAAIFHQLGERGIYVVGDIGCYTLGATQPFSALDANLCMGASISVLDGYLSVMKDDASKNAVAVIGDSTFFHSGIPPLLSAISSGNKGTVIILDNSGSAMTGFQETYPPFSMEEWNQFLSSVRVPKFDVVPALDTKIIDRVLDEHLNADSFSVMVLKGDCVQSLPKKGPTNFRYVINQDSCTSCGKCLTTDCPSIVSEIQGEKAFYEITNECIGCGFCSQVCPEQAIMPMIASKAPKFMRDLYKGTHWYRTIKKIRSNKILSYLFDRIEREKY